ncbi:quinoprotein relay system zinc metallohydrolase 2 [Chelativorans xinjiangense]|uniref:quinoprotein relay system zinc metallohydrolase 2 n=1 Tax=Chelativorans xinjiangense TaxID=2681485 RepID=UPI00135CD64C|nr:quinoprotein relay system zinc metallohydrolase 2 [Chelativorans xinjiangense]
MEMRAKGRGDLKEAPSFHPLASSPGQIPRRAFLCAGAAVFAATTFAKAARSIAAEATLPFIEVADGVFVRYGVQEEMSAANCGAIANIGFIVGDESVAVIDTGTTRQQGLALREAVASATSRPVSHLIATHVHPDHCFGHAAFSDLPVHSIGHRNLPRALAERGPFYLEQLAEISPDFSDTAYVPPDKTVSDTMRIDLGNRPLLLKAWPPAHTDNDLTIFDERAGLLWAADLLFAGRLPTLDGSLTGWLAALEILLSPDVRHVVPGHGPVSDGVAALLDERAYLTRLHDGVRAAIDEGLDISATLARLENDNQLDWLLFDTNHGRNVVAAYTELEWE